MPTNTAEERRQLEQRLVQLAGAVRFTWGQAAYWSDGEVEVCVDRVWNSDDQLEHLVTVSVLGRLMPASVLRNLPWTVTRTNGATIRQAETDRRGQFRLQGLEAGDYQLSFALPPKEMLLPGSVEGGAGELLMRKEISFSLAASDEDYGEAKFSSADERTSGSLEWSGRVLKLIVERSAPVLGDRLIRFQIVVEDLLVQGYVGLYEFEEGKQRGEVLLTALNPALRQREAGGCSLALTEVALDALKTEDRDDLNRSIEATGDKRSRQALEDALRRVVDAG